MYFCFCLLAIGAMLVRRLGYVFCTMSGNAQCLMPKIGLVESCEKKVCLDFAYRTCHNV
jgi:hypothetical protein